MILKAIIDDREYSLEVSEKLLSQAEGLFAKLDEDMDGGWQMSREWVASPDRVQRCQIVANKLLTALEKENHRLGMLMAGYILTRLPGVESVEPDTHGEIQNTQFILRDQSPAPGAGASRPPPALRPGAEEPSKLEAMEQAGHDVSKVFKVGKGFRFSVFDHSTGQWRDSPLIATEQDAERLRQEAFKERFDTLHRERR